MKIDDSFGDKVIIRQLVVEAILGILPTERVTQQPVHIDITVFTNTRHPAQTKDIADAVDYAALADVAGVSLAHHSRISLWLRNYPSARCLGPIAQSAPVH